MAIMINRVFYDPVGPFDPAKQVICFVNGEFDPKGLNMDRVLQANSIIAVDGGLKICHQLGLIPHLLVGDFDSIDPMFLSLYAHVPRRTLIKDKDETDLENALSGVDLNEQQVTVIGGLGKRTDHVLYHLALLARYPGKVFLESPSEWIFAVSGQVEFATHSGQTVSVFQWGGLATVSTQGLHWNLSKENLISQSNRAEGDKVIIQVFSGIVICIVQI